MRKLVSIWFCFFMIFTFVWAYHCDTSYSVDSIIDSNYVSFSLSYDENRIEDNPVDIVSSVAEKTNIDILVSEVSYKEGNRWQIYFKTNSDDAFVRINTSKGTSLLNNDECFTNTDFDTNGLTPFKLKTPAKSNIIIYPFEQLKIQGYDISNCIFYCKRNTSDELYGRLTDKGFEVVNYSYSVHEVNQDSYILLIPASMFLVAVIFYTLSEGKKIVLMKMDGFSSIDIITNEILNNLRFDLTVILSLSIINVIVVRFVVGYSLAKYFSETSGIFKLSAFALVLSIAIRLIITTLTNQHKHIKGAVPNTALYTMVNIVKTISFIALSLFCIITIITNVIPAYNEYRSSVLFAEKIKNRASFNLYGSYEQGLLDDQNENLLPFYKEVCEDYDALYIDASEYEYVNGQHIWEQIGETNPRIDINENYLNFSNIYDLNGNKITNDSLDPESLNVLIPGEATDEIREEVEIYRLLYKIDNAELLQYDPNNFDMYSYILGGVDSDLGMIKTPPVIYVYNYKIFESWRPLTSQILYGKLYVKTSSDDPESELNPLLKKYNIESTIDRISSADESITEYLEDTRDYLIKCILSSLLIICIIIAISLFSADIYCRNNSLKISVGMIEGKSITSCVRKHLLLQIAIYASVYLVILIYSALHGLGVVLPALIITSAVIVDFLLTYVRCTYQSRKNLYGIIKGEK